MAMRIPGVPCGNQLSVAESLVGTVLIAGAVFAVIFFLAPSVLIAQGPLPQQTPIPSGPTPAFIQPETTKKVKKATAYLKVVGNDDKTAEGSGFFGVEPGLVLTNAHVVNMLLPGNRPPKKIEVVVHSGSKDEFTFEAQVLGVDRENDLALLRVKGDKTRMPDPLPVELGECSLTELQKVYIFGFPMGVSLGKEITASESSVSSFRKDADGVLFQIQVNGGMNPGNSGGPVVDARGVVVGVAVSIIKGTQLNFAVPSEKIQGALHGKVQESYVGEAFKDGQTVKLPLTVMCLDPLGRIKEVHADIWTGPNGPNRPATFKAPNPLPNDSPKKNITLNYDKSVASFDVVLPSGKLPPNHVYWIQPNITNAAGVQQWGAATTYKPSDLPPLERIPVKLAFNAVTEDHSLQLTSKFEFSMHKGKFRESEAAIMHMEVLENQTATPTGTDIKLALGNGGFTTVLNRKIVKGAWSPLALAKVRHGVFPFKTDAAGKIVNFGFITYKDKAINVAEDANSMSGIFVSTYQATNLSVPNREVKPLETWNTNVRLLVGSGKRRTCSTWSWSASTKAAERSMAKPRRS